MPKLGPYRYSITADQYTESMQRLLWVQLRRRPFPAIQLFLIAICLAMLVGDAMDGFINIAAASVAVLTLPVLVATLRWMTTSAARRSFARTPALSDENCLTVEEGLLVFRSRTVTYRQSLAELAGFIETETLILVDRTDQSAHIVPKMALGDELQDFRQYLEEAGVRRL
ncbi:YcxB family protein [Qipengyuania sp. 6D47A]|uniref:YcxB family protein n=1 Tax=Qipengyuania qiaonensis TaxID=2867240 RepID=A0ABS7J7R8_9SPHN|nr:YcxB family protein [Qipengyuania qiaonensis]